VRQWKFQCWKKNIYFWWQKNVWFEIRPKNGKKKYVWTSRDFSIDLSCLLDVTFHYQLSICKSFTLVFRDLTVSMGGGEDHVWLLNLSEFNFTWAFSFTHSSSLSAWEVCWSLSSPCQHTWWWCHAGWGQAKAEGNSLLIQKRKECTITNRMALWRTKAVYTSHLCQRHFKMKMLSSGLWNLE